MTRRILLVALAVLLLAFAGRVHAASLLVNGSFEEAAPGSSVPSGNFATLSSGSTAILGWTVDSGSIDWINNYWQPSDGELSLDMSGRGAGAISQTIATVAGQWYRLSFDIAGNVDSGDTIKNLLVDVQVDDQLFSFSTTGQSRSDMGWERRTFDFQAADTSTTVGFISQESNAWGPALDNAAVTVVPLPAATLPGIALLAAFGLRRRMTEV